MTQKGGRGLASVIDSVRRARKKENGKGRLGGTSWPHHQHTQVVVVVIVVGASSRDDDDDDDVDGTRFVRRLTAEQDSQFPLTLVLSKLFVSDRASHFTTTTTYTHPSAAVLGTVVTAIHKCVCPREKKVKPK